MSPSGLWQNRLQRFWTSVSFHGHFILKEEKITLKKRRGGTAMKKIEMIKGAKKIVDECTKVKEGENVLIITDTGMPLSIAETLAIACKERGAEPVITIMSPVPVDFGDPPPPVGEAMQKAQVILMACSRSIFHSQSRIRAMKAGARCFTFAEFTEEDMIRGAIEGNFLETKELGDKIGAALARAKEARVTTPGGTDLYLDFRGRPEKVLILNGLAHDPGESKAIILEVAISPKVGSAQGIIVCDASLNILHSGLIKEPVKAIVKDGKIVEISGGDEARKLSELLAGMSDPKVYNVVELGIGFNPKAKMIGVQTQDKGVYGTGHIGFGSNISWGGDIKAETHFDFIMYAPKIELDGKTILENYQFNL
jgi:leucyl aminopeptidase (aminopeptidase T)